MVKVRGVHVLIFNCRDTVASLAFYRDVLGIAGELLDPPPEAQNFPERDRPDAGAAWIECGNVSILLHPAEDVSRDGVTVHFEVDDVDEMVNRVSEAGFEVLERPRDHPFRGRIAAVLDPDNRRIGLIRPLKAQGKG